ncbi:hypothetical protein GCM10027035_10760 [Emticicia sediminis]
MERLYKNIYLTFLLTIFVIIKSYSCSCDGEWTVPKNIKYSDVVFSGQVISKTLTANFDSLGVKFTGDTTQLLHSWAKNPTFVVKIKVDKIFKGKTVSDTLTILTPPFSASCGYNFQVGLKYIIYATTFDQTLMTGKLKRRASDDKTFWTHQCTRTRFWNSTEENEINRMLLK